MLVPSWTLSQIWDLCLMSSWEEQREHAEHHMMLPSWDVAEKKKKQQEWQRDKQREVVIFFPSSLIYLLPICLCLTHKWLLKIKTEGNWKTWQGSCIFIAMIDNVLWANISPNIISLLRMLPLHMCSSLIIAWYQLPNKYQRFRAWATDRIRNILSRQRWRGNEF